MAQNVHSKCQSVEEQINDICTVNTRGGFFVVCFLVWFSLICVDCLCACVCVTRKAQCALIVKYMDESGKNSGKCINPSSITYS